MFASTPHLPRYCAHHWTESELIEELRLDLAPARGATKAVAAKKCAIYAPGYSANDGGAIFESGRNNELFRRASAMRRQGRDQNDIELALHKVNLEFCKPPLGKDEVAGIAASAMRYPPSVSLELGKSLTDAGNAERFGARYEDSARFVVGLGWHVWNGQFWLPDTLNSVMEMAKTVAREIYLDGDAADDATRISVAKHAKSSQSSGHLKAMLNLAESLPSLVTSAIDLDTHDHLLGVANGVVDLNTGNLRESRRTDLLTRHSPVAFDRTADCPQFKRFVAQVAGGDQALVAYLQRVVGYTLTGYTSEQCLFFLHGGGANGKSTFLNVLKDLLGPELCSQTPSETLMTRRPSASNDLARLRGVRLVIANEVEDGSLLAESLIKQITGGDTLTARFHFQEFFEFVPKFSLMIAGNHLPIIRGRDNGIWRRIRLVPFEVTFTAEQQDKDLAAKLRAELPGILNWALAGAKAWQVHGLREPEVISKAVTEYRQEMDVIGQWLADCCAVGAEYEIRASHAYSSYKCWAETASYKPMASGAFSRELACWFKKAERKDANYFLGFKTGTRP